MEKCIEARELIIALPEGLYHYEHDYLIKHFATDFKKKYGPYLATKKIGKNNPVEEQIKADNEVRQKTGLLTWQL